VWYSIQTPSIYFPRDGIFFFSLGAYFSLNGKDIVSILSKWYKPSMIVYIILSIILSIIFFYNIENLYCLKLLNILVGIVFYISFAEYLSHGKIINATQKYFGHEILFESNRLQYASNKTKIELLRYANNIMTVNELREVFNLAPREGGDIIMQDLNHIDSNIANDYQVGTDSTTDNESEEEGGNENEGEGN
jgi:hypothetical protein